MTRLTPELRAQIREALDASCHSLPLDVAQIGQARSQRGAVLFTGKPSGVERESLLEQLQGGNLVELEIDFRPFQQVEGVRNRNFTRFRGGLLRKLSRSYRGVPLLADHVQWDLDRRAGTVTESNVEPIDGGYAFAMTARVTAPWAVESVLRGNFDRFSIGWDYPGLHAIECSVHREPIFTECDCFPGDVLADDDGNEQVVEFVFNEAEGVEVSAVSVPAVPGTYIDQIRTALSRAAPRKEPEMNLKEIAKALGLPDSATEAEIVAAASAAGGVVKSLSEQLDAERSRAAEAEQRARDVEIESLFAAHADRFPPERDASGNKARSKLETSLRQVAATNIELARSTLAALPKVESAPKGLQSLPEHARPSVPDGTDPNAAPGVSDILQRQLEALDCTVEDLERFGPQAMPTPKIKFGQAATRQHTARTVRR